MSAKQLLTLFLGTLLLLACFSVSLSYLLDISGQRKENRVSTGSYLSIAPPVCEGVSLEKRLFPPEEKSLSLSYPSLQSALSVTHIPSRPGSFSEKFQLQINGLSEPRQLHLQKPIYLSFMRASSGNYILQFKDHSAFSLTPVQCADGFIVFAADLKKDEDFFPAPFGRRYWRLPVKKVQKSSLVALEKIPEALLFAKGKLRGEDLYKAENGQEKRNWVSFSSGEAIALQEGMCLFWDGQSWKEGLAGDREEPVIRVESISSCVDCSYWSASGEKYAVFSLAKAPSSSFSPPSEKFILAASLKTPKKITLQMEGSKLVLQKGSWAVKKGKAWQAVPSKDIERLITHYPSFFLERIYKKNRKKWLSGKLYSPLRTACHTVSSEIRYDAQKTSRGAAMVTQRKRPPR